MQMEPQVTPTATLFFPTAYPYATAPFAAAGVQPANHQLVHFAADDISAKRMGIIHQIPTPHHHHHQQQQQQILIHPHGGHFIVQQIAVPLISEQSAAATASQQQQQAPPAQTAPAPAAEHLFAPASGGDMFRFQPHRQPANAHQIIIPAPAPASAGSGFSAKLCQQQTVEINLGDLAHKSFASKSQQRKKKVSPSAKRRSRKRLMAFLEAKRKKECPTILETEGESSLADGEDKQAFVLGEATVSMEQQIASSVQVGPIASSLSADDVTSTASSSPPSTCDVADL